MGGGRRPDPGPRGARPARCPPPGGAHAALPRRAAGARGRPPPRPHRARHRGAAGAGARRVPPDLRGRGGLAMTDPFEALREPVTPVDPDPGFYVALRLRLTREVFAPPGGTMSQQTVTTRVEREPAWPPALTPYIVVSDARRAMDWYVEVFGAQRRGELHVNADGTIGHAEVGIGDAVLMFAEASDLWPDVPVRAPDSPTTFSHTLHLDVDDVDASTERARRNGASVEREPADQPYGRSSVIVDPFGHRWILLRPPARAGLARPTDPDRPPVRLRQGDVANVTMLARDTR